MQCVSVNMKGSLSLICLIYLIGLGFKSHLNTEKITPQIKISPDLVFTGSLTLPAAESIKSVLFNSAGTKLYALNLEGMSIYEFDRENKRMLKKIDFKPTRAKGWDYMLRRSIPSFAEKPVEGCFSHQDKILWVSLHNAGGVIPIVLDTLLARSSEVLPGKEIYVTDFEKQTLDTLHFPLIETGAIPKVIAKASDSKFLVVSNWQSKSVSVLKINDTLPPYAKKIATIKLSAIPRGIAIDDKKKKTYVALMGGSNITVINNNTWKIERNLQVSLHPRHIVMDNEGRLFVSFNAIARVACFEARTGKLLFKAGTHLQPRTIALSNDQRFLFVTCYAGNTIDVFKINRQGFKRIYSLACQGKPVGIALYESRDKLEAWVCSYMADYLKIFVFNKSD